MIATRASSASYTQRINRAPSPVLARAVPWITVSLGSAGAFLPVIASTAILPPLGFLMLLAWRQLRPGLLPVWAGLPLGLVDDLLSGQPFGSGIVLWSATMLAMELLEERVPWRNFLLDWLLAGSLILAYLLAGVGLANLAGAQAPVWAILPQIVLSLLVFPLIGRLVALLDRFRLAPLRAAA